MLEYDDSAFYYFSISILSFLLFPATISMLYTLYTGVVKVENFTGQCLCNWCSTLIRAKKRESRASVFNKAFYIKLIIAAFFWYLWIKNFEMVMSIEALQSFDPFAILDVGQDATMKEIKKAYRRLSLEKHPDKNPDNPLAVQEFIRLTKAYTVSSKFFPAKIHARYAYLFISFVDRYSQMRLLTRTLKNTETQMAQEVTQSLLLSLDTCSSQRINSLSSGAHSLFSLSSFQV